MSRKRSKTQDSKVIPLRMPDDLAKEIRKLSDKTRLSDADIMRLAIERGLKTVEEMFRNPETAAA